MNENTGWQKPHDSLIAEGFRVRRSLPFRGGRGVGPFVFLDHMGPLELRAGATADVGAHPHIGLATLTYLFEGDIEHRDSLGTIQVIRPGDVNWMTAGRGISHAEKTPPASRGKDRRLEGLQCWVALPRESEDVEPSFEHHAAPRLPEIEGPGLRGRLIAGEAFGRRSPVRTYSRLFYVHAQLEAGARLDFDPSGQEAALYLLRGDVEIAGEARDEAGLYVAPPGARLVATSRAGAEFVLLGGDALAERRTIWWNFVASSKEKIEDAKRRWRAQEFGRVPGETTWIPLPGETTDGPKRDTP